MFVEFKTTTSSTGTGSGLRAFAYMLDYVLTSTTASRTTAIAQGLQYYIEWSTANDGAQPMMVVGLEERPMVILSTAAPRPITIGLGVRNV